MYIQLYMLHNKKKQLAISVAVDLPAHPQSCIRNKTVRMLADIVVFGQTAQVTLLGIYSFVLITYPSTGSIRHMQYTDSVAPDQPAYQLSFTLELHCPLIYGTISKNKMDRALRFPVQVVYKCRLIRNYTFHLWYMTRLCICAG